jgi:hypothetical protein
MTLTASHDGNHTRALHLREGWAAFLLYDITASDEAPLDIFHISLAKLLIFG